MKLSRALACKVLLGLLVVLMFPICSEASETTITTVDSNGAVARIHLRVVSTISGQTVFEGKTDDYGVLIVSGLDARRRYQVQTDDGNVWSRPFKGGRDVKFDLDAEEGGWDIYGEFRVGLGSTTARYEAANGSDATTSSLGVSLEINVGTIGEPAFVFGHPIRPILETGLEFPLTRPSALDDQLGNEGSLQTSIRWRTGIGISTPLRLPAVDLSADAVLAYVLSDSKFTTKSPGLETSGDRFLGHAMDFRLGVSAPLYDFAGAILSATAEFSVLVPLAGSATNSAGVEASEDVAYRGILGFRVLVPNKLGGESWRLLRRSQK